MEQLFERSMTVHVIVKTKDTTNVIDVNGWLRPKELLWREYSCNLIKNAANPSWMSIFASFLRFEKEQQPLA